MGLYEDLNKSRQRAHRQTHLCAAIRRGGGPVLDKRGETARDLMPLLHKAEVKLRAEVAVLVRHWTKTQIKKHWPNGYEIPQQALQKSPPIDLIVDDLE